MTEKSQDTATKKVAILIESHVEDSEFQVPYAALTEAGALISVLGSRMNEKYLGKQGKVSVEADGTTTEMRAADFDAVIIPGGMAPDRMRTNMKTVRFVQDAMEQGILVAAVCHGPQVLIEGDLLKGKHATGFRAIRKDMQNAGANYSDEPLVTDNNLITSRRPADLPIFATAILRHLGLRTKGADLPQVDDQDFNWQQLGEQWGGSKKAEITDALNTAIRGERYALEAFGKYEEKATDADIKTAFREIGESKQRHLQMLEGRLAALGGQEGLQAAGSGAWATMKSWFQSSDDTALLLRALGDLQTGVVDAFNMTNKFTDPATASIFDEIEVDIAKHEQRVADLYHTRLGDAKPKAAQPTTGTAASA
jgi:protease I